MEKAKIIANRLINLPAEDRQWAMSHLSPATFRRWAIQGDIALRTYDGGVLGPKRTFNEKVRAHRLGEEQLSSLAIAEGSSQ